MLEKQQQSSVSDWEDGEDGVSALAQMWIETKRELMEVEWLPAAAR